MASRNLQYHPFWCRFWWIWMWQGTSILTPRQLLKTLSPGKRLAQRTSRDPGWPWVSLHSWGLVLLRIRHLLQALGRAWCSCYGCYTGSLKDCDGRSMMAWYILQCILYCDVLLCIWLYDRYIILWCVLVCRDTHNKTSWLRLAISIDPCRYRRHRWWSVRPPFGAVSGPESWRKWWRLMTPVMNLSCRSTMIYYRSLCVYIYILHVNVYNMSMLDWIFRFFGWSKTTSTSSNSGFVGNLLLWFWDSLGLLRLGIWLNGRFLGVWWVLQLEAFRPSMSLVYSVFVFGELPERMSLTRCS